MAKRGRKAVAVHSFIDGVEHKLCLECWLPQPITTFRKSTGKWDGLVQRCRPCEANIRERSLTMQHDAEKFWRQVRRGSPNECWEWQGPLQCKGYGQLSVLGKSWRAHRYAMFLTHGSIPADKVVMHACDNRRCCNPNHLSLGTQLENIADQDRKGGIHRAHGARHGRAKLNEDLVRQIRASSRPDSEWARELGVYATTINAARVGKKWRHVV